MDLFERSREEQFRREAPLALRMRPRTLDEFVGQEHIVGPGRLLRRAIQADQLSSILLWGPTGSGKTTLARVVANTTSAYFEQLNAVTSGVAEIRRVIEEARARRGMHGRRTILFIDEIHRFNKAQQDALLPSVEDGMIILIGATTENPYFEVNAALVSRSRVFQLRALSDEDVALLMRRALDDAERGLGRVKVTVDDDAFRHIVRVAGGDARSALNALELAAATTDPDEDGVCRITLTVAEESIQRRALAYDREGDQHYDTISAFIKSVRGSDPDAALYWMARMLYAGEDPMFIARRLVILAAEDIGNADPQGLVVAVSAARAVEYLGLPEGRIPLAQATTYLATAPKSNAAYVAVDAALKDVEERRISGVPLHLRNPVAGGLAALGYGRDHKYPHDSPDGFIPQEYLPPELAGVQYYHPKDIGHEKVIRSRLQAWWRG